MSYVYLYVSEFTLNGVNYLQVQPGGAGPRGVLRYISDGDVRSPFLGLKFAI